MAHINGDSVTPVRLNWKLTVGLGGMTWGDIKRLARYAENAPDDLPVEYEWDGEFDEQHVVGIEVPGEML